MIRLPAIALALAFCCLTAQQASAVSATGGSRTNSYVENGTNFTAHIFTNSGTLTVSAGVTVEYLMVGGGGGGGRANAAADGAGGGGGGGVISGTTTITSGDKAIVVGAGGAGRSSSPGAGTTVSD